MSFFPILFIGTLAFSHVYIFWTLRRAFGAGGWQYAAVALIIFGLASPFLTRALANTPFGPTLANVSFLWLALVFVVTIVFVCRDALHIAALLLDRFGGTHLAARFGVTSLRLIVILGVIAFAYSLFEAYHVTASREAIRTDRLPAGTRKVRVVAVSDVHLTRRGDLSRLRRIVSLVNAQRPDIVVMLGDLVDDLIVDRDELSDELRRIDAPLGKFAVLGNHELYSGMDQSIQFTEKAGFTLLRGSHADAGPVVVAGVDDPAHGARVGLAEAVRGIADDRFVLFLSHRPESLDEVRGRFDLQLSGHTHGGQMRPGRLVTWLIFRRPQGLSRLDAGGAGAARPASLYLTNGAGYWGPPARFFAPLEIVVIDLERPD